MYLSRGMCNQTPACITIVKQRESGKGLDQSLPSTHWYRQAQIQNPVYCISYIHKTTRTNPLPTNNRYIGIYSILSLTLFPCKTLHFYYYIATFYIYVYILILSLRWFFHIFFFLFSIPLVLFFVVLLNGPIYALLSLDCQYTYPHTDTMVHFSVRTMHLLSPEF